MHRHRHRRLALAGLATALLAAAAPVSALAAGPTIERGSARDTFFDDFILDLCGIATMTTVKEHWQITTFADGSQQIHTTRVFVSEDPRLPIEKGAATGFVSPDGIKTVIGTPIHLSWPGQHRHVMLDAGRITLGDPIDARGPHTFLESDLADWYCPD